LFGGTEVSLTQWLKASTMQDKKKREVRPSAQPPEHVMGASRARVTVVGHL